MINEQRSLTFDEMLKLPPAAKKALGLEYTPFEIDQQPESWLETFRIIKSVQADTEQFLGKCGIGKNICRTTVSLIGAGTSDYIGRAVAALLRKQWRCHLQVVPSTDLLTEADEILASAPVDTQHLWISFSRSGDSFEGVKVIEAALERYPEINHLIVTCNEDGKMAAMSKGRSNVYCIVLDDKVNDRGLAMTSSFTNMVVAGQCLAHISRLAKFRPILESISSAARNAFPDIAALALKMAKQDHSRISFLGNGTLKAVGDESALKVMELTAGHYSVMSESFLGLRHGPLSWLNSDSLVVGHLSNDLQKLPTEIGLIDELKAKNVVKDIVLIAPRSADSFADENNRIALDLPADLNDNYRPPLDVIFAQCLGLFSSVRRNIKPDTPSSDGKIKRVVSEIKIGSLERGI